MSPSLSVRHDAHLVSDVAALQALLDTLGDGDGDVGLELGEVAGVDLLGEAEGGVDDGRVDVDEEVLGDGAGTGVLGVEAGDANGRLAVEVLLEVDRALGEDGTLELGQGRVELGRQTILQDEAGQHRGLGDQGEELGRVRVDVRGVKTAGVEEDTGSRNAQVSEDGEVGARRKVDLTSQADGGVGVGRRVEVELQRKVALLDLLLDLLEAGDAVVLGEEVGNRTL